MRKLANFIIINLSVIKCAILQGEKIDNCQNDRLGMPYAVGRSVGYCDRKKTAEEIPSFAELGFADPAVVSAKPVYNSRGKDATYLYRVG